MTATSTARRNSRRDNRSQRPRRPPSRNSNYSFESYKSGRGTVSSMFFHQGAAIDDMSEYQYSVDPSNYAGGGSQVPVTVNTHKTTSEVDRDDMSEYEYSIDPSHFASVRQVPLTVRARTTTKGEVDRNGDIHVDQQTIDDKSLYTNGRLTPAFALDYDQQTIDDKSLYTNGRLTPAFALDYDQQTIDDKSLYTNGRLTPAFALDYDQQTIDDKSLYTNGRPTHTFVPETDYTNGRPTHTFVPEMDQQTIDDKSLYTNGRPTHTFMPEMDQQTIDDKSLYTNGRHNPIQATGIDQQTIEDKRLYNNGRWNETDWEENGRRKEAEWEESRIRSAWERKRRMMIAGEDNSIPTMIIGPCGGQAATSRLNMNSMRSILSIDPTEAESYETVPTAPHNNLGDVDEDAATLFPEPRPPPPKKKNFMQRVWNSIFANKKKPLRGSLPAKRMVRAPVSELWDSIEVRKKPSSGSEDQPKKPHSAPALMQGRKTPLRWTIGKNRGSRAPRRWTPKQPQTRRQSGTVELRVKGNGLRMWKRTSGTVLAEC